MPGSTVRAWGYNGQIPGPELRVREGDLVRITLRNDLPVPTTIHWHGVHLPPAMDGPAGLNQAPVEPGDAFVYEFVATPAGTRWYHSHADPALQIPLGLYGPLIIEPRSSTKTYDREQTLVLGEWDTELTPEVAAGFARRGPRDQTLRGGELGSDLFLINGHTHGAIPPIRIAEGERLLLRIINAGHLSHPIHIHGHSFKIVATDGNPVPDVAQWTKDTVLIGPAERYDLELIGENPGVWMVHCHIEHHMANGMMTVLAYDGHKPSGPAAEFFDSLTDSGSSGMAHGNDHAATIAADPEPTASATATATPNDLPSPPPTGALAEISMVDDRFEPNNLTVSAGTTVTWVNRGGDWHSIASYDGSFESGKLATGEFFSVRLDVPGLYQYICKHHGMQGMMGRITVI
ncbi:MAG: multicopper oxidase domain-containing protein [Chloroflexota bacterium]|nr:multicopper oxidase domain-containing protein [Chloroflexota bacterium]